MGSASVGPVNGFDVSVGRDLVKLFEDAGEDRRAAGVNFLKGRQLMTSGEAMIGEIFEEGGGGDDAGDVVFVDGIENAFGRGAAGSAEVDGGNDAGEAGGEVGEEKRGIVTRSISPGSSSMFCSRARCWAKRKPWVRRAALVRRCFRW